MQNLFKNVVRSFKNNKISLIGLSFLVFFGVGSFCVLSNTTTNITNEYTSVASKGAMHDFIISELYNVGTPTFQDNNGGIVVETEGEYPLLDYSFESVESFWGTTPETQITTNNLFSGNLSDIHDEGIFYFPVPQLKVLEDVGKDAYTFIRTYHITLDENLSTGLYREFAKYGDEAITSVDIIVSSSYKLNEIPTSLSTLKEAYEDQPDIKLWDANTCQGVVTNSIFKEDYGQFTNDLNVQTSNIYNSMTESNTPIVQYIESEESGLKDVIDYKYFKSLNISSSGDSIFYKVIESNPTDTIDKMVMFEDPVGRTGSNLFDVDAFAPYDSQLIFYKLDESKYEPGDDVDGLKVPSSFNEVATMDLVPRAELANWTNEKKFLYSQMLQIRFKRMATANNTDQDEMVPLLFRLSGRDITPIEYFDSFTSTTQGSIGLVYDGYYTRYYLGYSESITISANQNVVFTWTNPLGTIQTCTISNWTSKFSIVNPQHLEAINKKVIDPSVFAKFTPFTTWYKQKYNIDFGGEITTKAATEWINSLTNAQFLFWINPFTTASETMVYDNFPDHETSITITRGLTQGGDIWSGIDDQYIVSCGGNNQIIWGCGLTPDFMYPVVDISRPTPNTNTECLVYCNDCGYKTIKLGYLNAPVEEYITCRFKKDVDRQSVLDKINDQAATIMIYPEGTRAAYFATDTTCLLNASTFRIAYIPGLVNVVRVTTIVLSSFIGILCILICAIIIKRYVENNRINIGIMRANGISKAKIVLSLIPFAFFPALIGGIAAYFIGFFLQAPALLLFSNYWMLPTPLLGFSIWSFIGCIFLPFLLFSAISSLATLSVLRTKAVDLMKSGSEFKASAFSRWVKKPFKHFGIMTRFRVSLAFNSLLRLGMLALMSTLTMSSLVFAMSTFDRLSQSQQINSSQFEYNFSLDLITPTSSGGPYTYYDVSQNKVGVTDEDAMKNYIYNTNWDLSNSSYSTQPWYVPEATDTNPTMYHRNLTKPYYRDQWMTIQDLWDAYSLVADNYSASFVNTINEHGALQLPGFADATGQVEDLTYLQHRINSRLLLDYNIGIGSITSNPWEIALALMPANSRNMAADAFNTIVNDVGHLVYEANKRFEEEIVNQGLSINPTTKHISTTNYYNDVEKVDAATIVGGKWVTQFKHVNDERITPPFYQASSVSDAGYWVNEAPFFFEEHKIEGSEEVTYTLNSSISNVGFAFMCFNPSFIKLLKTIYSDLDLMQKEYFISYGMIPLNNDLDAEKKDETYTYVNGTINSISSKKEIDWDRTHEIKLEGIQKDSEFIKLTDKHGNNLNELLYNENQNENEHAIVVNAYVAHKYGLKVGDVIEITASNTVDRYERKLHPEKFVNDDSDTTKLKVVGISLGTNGEAFYTTQKVANDIVGLPDGLSWNKTHQYMIWSEWEYSDLTGWYLPQWSKTNAPKLLDMSTNNDKHSNTLWSFSGTEPTSSEVVTFNTNIPIGFNGVYTQNKQGRPLTTTVPLYSYTGVYPGASVYKSVGDNKMLTLLKANDNLAIVNKMIGLDDPKIYEACSQWLANEISEENYNKVISDFIDFVLVPTFGDTTMLISLCGAMDVAANDMVYKNLISTFNLAEVSIMAIIIPITIIIVGIISNLIINDSKKMAAMLKALGYGDTKNAMSILALFVPTIAIGLLLAIPLSFGLLAGYQSILFSTANILVDITQQWWYYAVATAGIGVILISTYVVGFISLKKDRLVDQIK